MLFDLTGRGRHRTVRVVYSGLALLFLLGFVGFGVGTFGGGGGIAELFGEGRGGGEIDYGSRVKKAQMLTEQQPNNAAAWISLIHSLLLQSTAGDNYGRANAIEWFAPKAQPLLFQIQTAWNRYLELKPHHPSPELAAEVLRIYSLAGGLENPSEAVGALKIQIAAQPPSPTLYYRLASEAYAALDLSEGDRASKRAIALAPAGERTILQNYLSKAKAAGAQRLHHNRSHTTSESQIASTPASVSSPPKETASSQTVPVPTSSLAKGLAPKAVPTTSQPPSKPIP